jgi:hypothetical protein
METCSHNEVQAERARALVRVGATEGDAWRESCN